MSNEDLRYAKQLMDMRVAEGRRQAEERRLQSIATAGHTPVPVTIGSRILRRSGLLLVALGGRLVRFGLPPYRSTAMGLGQRGRS